MIRMTPREALAIQAKHVEYYKKLCPDLAEKVAAKTNIEGLDLDKPMDVVEINKLIPRGANIELLCGLNPNRFD